MVLWIGGSAISKTKYWVKEFLAEGEPRMAEYVRGIRAQYVETRAEAPSAERTAALADLVVCGKYAADAYLKAYGKVCA